MSKQFSLALVFTFALLVSLLLLLNQSVAVSSSELAGKAFSPPAASLPSSGLCEPNPPSDNDIYSAGQITVGVSIQCETEISPTSDIDYYVFDTTIGQNYRAEVTRLNADDVRIRLYNNAGAEISDKTAATTSTSERADFTWTAEYSNYYVSVEGKYGDEEGGYSLRVIEVATTPTDTPTATPIPWDSCEINDDKDGTWSDDTPPGGPCQLSVGVEKSGLNFVPYSGQLVPNDDYFTFLAKAGNTYRISTEVQNGADTIMQLYNPSGEFVAKDDDSGTGAGSLIQAVLGDGMYKILVQDRTSSTNPSTLQTYDILVENVTVTSTPTPTPAAGRDACEDNDNRNAPCTLSLGVERSNMNFIPASGDADGLDDDYYQFPAKQGHVYRITTDVSGGADTEMWLYTPSYSEQLAYDDDGGDGLGSAMEVALGDGYYKILVRDRMRVASPSSSQTYDILVEDVTGAAATSPPPSIPGKPDAFEPNYSFERASLIGLDAKYTNLNFVPWTGTDPDTDFYKLWVIAGKIYTCETFDLGTAANTNMIFCRGPSWDHCFAGNDDVQPFEPATPHRSRLTFFSDYDNWLYIMLGQVGAEQILPEEWKNLSYSLKCSIGLPGTATPTPTSPYVAPSPTPQPTTSLITATPIPGADDTSTPQPPAPIVVRTMTAPTPPPAPPPPTAAPRLYDIELLLYYDENQNGQADPGEGISDVLARAYDALSGGLLSIDYTDELGALRFTVPADGPVRVSVPFFGFNQVITTITADIQIRIAPLP